MDNLGTAVVYHPEHKRGIKEMRRGTTRSMQGKGTKRQGPPERELDGKAFCFWQSSRCPGTASCCMVASYRVPVQTPPGNTKYVLAKTRMAGSKEE
jgi:hypothetical protein